MADIGDIAVNALGTGGAAAVVVAFAKKWFDDREKERIAANEKLAEIEVEAKRAVLEKLNSLESGQDRIETALRDVTTKSATQEGVIKELKDRVSKGFKFHRRELEKLTSKVARLELEAETAKAKKR